MFAFLIDNRSHCVSNAVAMYICVCKAVTDRQIQRAVREDGVISLRELTREMGLGTCCGKCVPAAREVLGAALSTASPANLHASFFSSDSAAAPAH